MKRRSVSVFLSALAVGLLFGVAPNSGGAVDAAKSVKDQLLELTGGRRAKVVWSQGASDANHVSSPIKLFDTKAGVVQELPFTGIQPWLTPDGRRVIALSGTPLDRKLMMYDTETKKVTTLCTGPHSFPLAIWRDPKTKRDWVYVNAIDAGGEFQKHWSDGQDKMFRFPLDKPEARELFWDRTKSSEFFMLSADGTRACFAPTFNNIGQMTFAFDAQGKVDQDNSVFKPLGHGCFPGMAPDNSYRLFYLGGNHHAITMHDAEGANPRQIKVGDLPGVKGQSWLTRWSTHPRYLTLMGPDSQQAGIWMGRFDEKFTQVEAWVRVSAEGPKCWKSHAWIEPGPPARRFNQR